MWVLGFRHFWDIHEMVDRTKRQKLASRRLLCYQNLAFLEPRMLGLIWFCWAGPAAGGALTASQLFADASSTS